MSLQGLRRVATMLVGLVLFMLGALSLYALARGAPEDMPWTPLDLGRAPGTFTGAKLTGLTEDADQCRAVLDRAGVRYVALPLRREGGCGYDDAVRFAPGGARTLGFLPAGLGVSCPVAASLAAWEWHVVQPAARRYFGQRVAAVEHFGAYSCRRLYGRDAGAWSEHSTADAVDIAGFRLADGRRISVVGDWNGKSQDAAFLRAVRDGACSLFASTLSPDYNAAHRDHLHLDHASRGRTGWRACR